VKVNISKLEAGQQIIAEWRGQPVFVSRRTPEALAILEENVEILADPESEASVQPEYVNPHTRAIKPEVLVVMGICTHLGCSPLFRPEVASADMGNQWKGGYFCPCHSSRYDMAGRVHSGQPAPLNLPVPPHSYESDDVIILGLDQETA
jgi:ubiquinol-cytochrome c reductase iron-sulfur subunit